MSLSADRDSDTTADPAPIGVQISSQLAEIRKLVGGAVCAGTPLGDDVTIRCIEQDLRGLLNLVGLAHRIGADTAGPEASAPEPAPPEPATVSLERLGKEFAAEIEQDGANPLLEGTSARMSIASVFGFLADTRQTGQLRVRTGDESLRFEIINGVVVACSTDSPRPDDCLGARLVARGLIEREVLLDFLDRSRDSDEPLGAALLREELVTAPQLREALEIQVQQRFYRAVASQKAVFGFFPRTGEEHDDHIQLAIETMLLEIARATD